MTYRGRVRNGTIVLDPPVSLPEGTEVEVRPATTTDDVNRAGSASDATAVPTVYDRLKDVIGKAEGFPPDYSRNHDRYLYGTSEE